MLGDAQSQRLTLPSPPRGPTLSHLLSPYTHPSASVAYGQLADSRTPSRLTSSLSTIVSVGIGAAALALALVLGSSLLSSLANEPSLPRLNSPLFLCGLDPMIMDCGRPVVAAGLVVRAFSLSRPFVKACSAIDCALLLAVCGSSIAGTLTFVGEVPNEPLDLFAGTL